MPTVPIRPPSEHRTLPIDGSINPLPRLLHTPSGLALLEIQGTINMPAFAPSNESDTSSPSSVPLGRLVFPDYSPTDLSEAWMKCVHLYVGRHQRMTGEVKKLPNPMAVLRRVAKNAAGSENEELEIGEIIYYK
ncbi:MAG: hypothetical protein Q9214_003318, partial [Letrouitia sp. 1 TL-2023]